MPKMRAGAVEVISTKRFSDKFTGVNAVMKNQLQTIFDTRSAIRNFCEIVFTQDFLVFETERAVVRGNHLKMIVLQTVPKLR